MDVHVVHQQARIVGVFTERSEAEKVAQVYGLRFMSWLKAEFRESEQAPPTGNVNSLRDLWFKGLDSRWRRSATTITSVYEDMKP